MRASFLGCPIDILTMAETVEVARDAMRDAPRCSTWRSMSPSSSTCGSTRCLRPMSPAATSSAIDGMGIVWAARALGLPVTTRVTGVDLLNELLAVCEREGFRPYFLGATPEVLQRAAVQSLRANTRTSGSLVSGMAISARSRKPKSSAKSAPVVPIASSSACRRHARSASWPPIATNSACPSSWESAGSFDILGGMVTRAPARCSDLVSNGFTASTKNRGACGGGTPRPTRCLRAF